jgi:NTP pyrophosphatase (non-canonical NTP hydrolase)
VTHPPFTFKEYTQNAVSTWEPPAHKPKHLIDEPILNAALGIGGEAGEVLDLIKKMYFPSKPRDETIDFNERIEDELGDVLYYITILGWLLDIPLDAIARRNNAKLLARHRPTKEHNE